MSLAAVRALPIPPFPDRSGYSEPTDNTPPRLDPDALYGLAGEVVGRLREHVECDDAALLVAFHVMFGSAVGPRPHGRAAAVDHPARIFAVIVGSTAKARKSTAIAVMRNVFREADPGWDERIVKGLSTGEGLINAAKNRDKDDRILVEAPEFGSILAVKSREGATLSPVLCEAWDGEKLAVLTRSDPLEVAGKSISILGAITSAELRERLRSLDASNGFGNRFLFVLSNRARNLPRGGNLDGQVLAELGTKIAQRVEQVSQFGRIHRDKDGEVLWERLYNEIAADNPMGMLEGLCARADAHTFRLSVNYALADGSPYITERHVRAAYAMWSYCQASAAFIFGDALGDPDADKILSVLAKAGGTMNKTALGSAIGFRGARLDRSLDLLMGRGRVSLVPMKTEGRTAHLLVLTQ